MKAADVPDRAQEQHVFELPNGGFTADADLAVDAWRGIATKRTAQIEKLKGEVAAKTESLAYGMRMAVELVRDERTVCASVARDCARKFNRPAWKAAANEVADAIERGKRS